LGYKIRFSNREIVLLLAVLILALSLTGWRLVLAPLSGRYTALRSNYAELLQEQNRLQAQLLRREELLSAREEWLLREPLLNRLFPSPDKMPEVLARLDTLLTSSSVTLHSFQAGKLTPGEDYTALQVKLHASGEPEALLVLLEHLERFEHLLIIDQIEWSRDKEAGAALKLTLLLIFHPLP